MALRIKRIMFAQALRFTKSERERASEQRQTCRNIPCDKIFVHVPIIKGTGYVVENHCPAAAAIDAVNIEANLRRSVLGDE